jgi:hypothetical protein|tara:strand:+ start:3062 stop:3415 length:354 start_codon:yes stop_codon:yes gene_type:complete
MPLKRVCLEPVDKAEYNDDEWKIALDLVLLDDGVPFHNWTTFGVRGGMAEDSACIEPFMLFKDGTIDFGTDFEENRTCKSNFLTGRRFSRDELFTVTLEDGDEVTYRVTRIIDLDTR